MNRYTGMFYLYTFDGEGKKLDERLFIGTMVEALDELKEEFKEFFPDDYDRKDAAFWRKCNLELSVSVDQRTQVSGRCPVKGSRRFRIERSGPMRLEAQ